MTVWTTAVLRRSALLTDDLTWSAIDHLRGFICPGSCALFYRQAAPRGTKDKSSRSAFPSGSALEMKTEFGRQGTRRYEVRAAKRGKEVVQRFLVRYIDGRDAQAPLVAVTMEQVVLAYAHVKQVARRDSRWILVVIFGAVGGNDDACRPVWRPGRAARKWTH